MKRVVRPEIFRNKRMTLRGITLFPFQSVGTEIPVHLRNSPSAEGWRLDFFPPFPMFGGERWSRAVAGFLFISYRIVQNGICSKLLWALLGFNFLETKQQQTAAISTIAKKAFHLTRKISGIFNRKFSLNGTRLGHHLESWGYKLQWFVKLSTIAPKPGPRFIV